MKYRRRGKLLKLKLRPETVRGIAAIGLAVFSGLIILATFAPRGAFLIRIHEAFIGFFSWGSPFSALILFQIALFLMKFKFSAVKPNAFIGEIIMLLALLGISQAGSLGQNLFQTIQSVVPISFGIFLILLGVSLFGLTIFLNLTLGEVVEIIKNVVQSIVSFFPKQLGLQKKTPPVFIRDNLGINPMNSSADKSNPAISQVLGPQKTDNQPRLPIEDNGTHTGGTMLGSRIIQNQAGENIIWEYPGLDLLGDPGGAKADRGDTKHNAAVIESTLESFGVTAKVNETNSGPTVTQYALAIALGTKLSKITGLQNDLALALAARGQIRIEAPIPGRSLVGVEVPNRSSELVPLRRILESEKFQNAKSKLTVAMGLDVSGNPQIADISKMPHALIAGSTNSGKSVCINAFLLSLLLRNSPNELKLILVDPKRVELSLYNGIPHLMTPVIVDLDKVLSALKWAILEMERRYKTFASAGVRNIDGYNEVAGFQALPYIVIVIDEMADLMMFAPVEVEDAVCRLAQMARATGIHLVLATQRPSVDVITGLIKANIPTRIAFAVTSMVDSRVIIDGPGAEKLLGYGDMLYVPQDQSKPSRIQGAFASDKDVKKIVEYLKSKGTPVVYTEEVVNMPLSYKPGPGGRTAGGGINGKDPLLDEAIKIISQSGQASASMLQRKLSIGFARAGRIMDTLQELGIVGPGEGSKARDVLIRSADEYFASRNQPESSAGQS